MLGNDVIQRDIIATLKSLPAVTSLLHSAEEVREDEYGGREFGYPALRVALGAQVYDTAREPSCDIARLSLTVRCYAEGDSSAQADAVAAAVNAALHRRFIGGAQWYGWLRSASLSSAIRVAPRLWRADVGLAVTVYPR